MKALNYLDVTDEAGAAFFSRPPAGPVVMLNLLRFRGTADYTDFPQLAPTEAISGEQAYHLYMEHTRPFLKELGSDLLFMGKSKRYLIGPEADQWDLVLLVRHPSATAFLQFASNEAYLAGMGHRTAALLDSRLLPIEEI